MVTELFESYKKIVSNEGMVLTSFKDGDDILNYTSAHTIICPLTALLDDLREITEEEDKVYKKELELKIREING